MIVHQESTLPAWRQPLPSGFTVPALLGRMRLETAKGMVVITQWQIDDKLKVRFWKKVDKNGPIIRAELGPCWIWTGSRSVVRGKKSYGTLMVVKPNGDHRPEGAHRISYVMECGDVPDGLLVLHHCDNKQCVRPSHLHVGTVSENAEEAYDRKLREPVSMPGESHPLAKLDWHKVNQIRFDFTFYVRSIDELAEAFNVSRCAIEDVVYNRTWKESDEPQEAA